MSTAKSVIKPISFALLVFALAAWGLSAKGLLTFSEALEKLKNLAIVFVPVAGLIGLAVYSNRKRRD